jgi:hypothetical protein
MNVIDPVSLSQLNSGEMIDTSSQLVSIVKPLTKNHDYIARQVFQIKASLKALVSIERTPGESEPTDPISGDDNDLDMLIALIWETLESGEKSGEFFRAKAIACQELLKFFKKRNREVLLRGSFSDQRVEVSALLSDLLHDSQALNRTASRVGGMIFRLAEIFEAQQDHPDDRNSDDNLPSTKREEKKILRYRLEKLLAFVDVNIVDKVDGFEAVKSPVNEVINGIMSGYRARVMKTNSENN